MRSNRLSSLLPADEDGAEIWLSCLAVVVPHVWQSSWPSDLTIGWLNNMVADNSMQQTARPRAKSPIAIRVRLRRTGGRCQLFLSTRSSAAMMRQ